MLEHTCSDCYNSNEFTITNEKTIRTYGTGEDAYNIEMVLPVHTCNNCGGQTTTGEAREIETYAYYKYQKEVLGIADEIMIQVHEKHYKDWLANYTKGELYNGNEST